MYEHGISVVIPNYNGISLLPHTLPPLFTALKKSGKPYEVIIVDDLSTDSSVSFIRAQFPDIILMQNEKNAGFSKTVNRGVSIAKYSRTLILNSDVKLTPNYFQNLDRYFSLPKTFGVMSKIIGWEDDVVQDGGKYPHFHGVKIKTSKNYIPLNVDSNDHFYSIYLSGANALVSTELFKKIGGFNELFSPFYVEDFELGLRAWRLGYILYFDPFTTCKHKVSATIASKEKRKHVRRIYNRNKMLLHFIHLPQKQLKAWSISVGAELIWSAITLRFYYLNAFSDFIAMKKEAITYRQQLEQQHELLSVPEVSEKIKSQLSKFHLQFFG